MNAGVIIDFMAKLHDCSICKHRQELITGKGVRRTLCAKYNSHVIKVRNSCIDRFEGFSFNDVNNIQKQFRMGTAEFITIESESA